MRYVNHNHARMFEGLGGRETPVIYVIDSCEHPFSLPEGLGLQANVVTIPVRDWNTSLTPWPAPGLYRGEPDFGGDAAATLVELCDEAIPAIEVREGLRPRARAVCGYSLGGLFSLYAFVNSGRFDACACLSGSVWYEGWVEYLRKLDVNMARKFTYLSLGTKEKRAARPLLQGVQTNMEECARILEQRGCAVRYVLGSGNHIYQIPERFAAGLCALDEWFMS